GTLKTTDALNTQDCPLTTWIPPAEPGTLQRLQQSFWSRPLCFINRPPLLELGRRQPGLRLRLRLAGSRLRGHFARRVVDVFLEFPDPLAHRACDLGDPLGSKEQEDHDHDDQQLGKTQIAKHWKLLEDRTCYQ